MNKEEIDELLKALIEEDEEKYFENIANFFGVSSEEIQENEEKYFENIANKIENGDYEYFKSLVTNPEYKEFVIDIFSRFSEDKNKDKYELIERRKELDIHNGNLVDLIKSINNEEFIKECIEKREGLGLTSYAITKLIKSINNEEFTKECIEKRKEFEFESYSIKELIRSINDENYTKECIKRREELGIELGELTDLILSINDEEFTKEYIERGTELGISSYYLIDLIESINDEKFIKECILKGNEIGLESSDIQSLIEKIQDEEFTKECIQRREEVGLHSYSIKNLIKLIDNEKFTKECIEKRKEFKFDSYCIKELIESVNDENFMKECILKGSEIGLDSEDIKRLIENINDNEITKKCVLEQKFKPESVEELIDLVNEEEFTRECVLKGKEIGLDPFSVASLVKKINDNEFTKKCVLEEIFRSGIVKELIDLVNEKEFTKECILKRVKLGLDSEYLIDKLKEINDSDFAKLMITNREDMELDGEVLCEAIKLSDTEMSQKINFDKLEELLTMKDAEYIKNHLLDNVILKNMENENVDVDKINEEIEKTYEIFLTNDLPKNFKYFEFFKNHERNYYSNNSEFYPEHDREKRDKIIAGDLFKTILESDNIKMRNFLENLYNGNLAINSNDESEISQAILLRYRDVLNELLDVVEPNTISKTEDYNKDLEEIRKYLNAGEKDDLGEILLLKYFENIGLDYKKREEPLIKTLLMHMELKKQEAKIKNSKKFVLEEGDVIKGTDLKYIGDFLQNGIRAKEFLMVGTIKSDATPLDTDFSEISKENLEKSNLEDILNSTCTGNGYGQTYLVVKKQSYEKDKVSYSKGAEGNKTRYFRTGIGATNISAIITEEWDDEYKYILASNGFYIPVIDKVTEKVLFTEDEYKKIRETMQGLSHFGTQDFILDEKANNISIGEQAEELREKAKGKISTEEKREKVVDKIRKNIGKSIITEMLGDISGRFLELIDTGSTGRGTNIPGDGDFDFMLKCKDKEEQSKMIAKIKTFISGRDKGGTNEFNIRYTDVEIDGLDEVVELDVTSEKKRLETEYSSDMAVRDRLNSIQAKYGEEGLKTVVDNIIVAKKILKENGVYKKANSIGGTDFGGFGGIGVENWILQNGGSFVRAMETFLENTVDENGNEIGFEQFKRKYPIYDFGQNHKDLGDSRHDHYVEGLTKEGFDKLKEVCREKLKELGEKNKEKDKVGDSIVKFTEEANGYKFSDLSQIYGLLAKFRTYELSKENNNRGVNE